MKRLLAGLALLGVAALALALAYAGYVWLPSQIALQLPGLAKARFGLDAHVQAISLDPLRLVARAEGISLAEPGGATLLAAKSAEVGLQWRSLLQGAWLVSRIRLEQPALHLRISKDGHLNLALAASKGPPPRCEIGETVIEDGVIELEDLRDGYRNRLDKISFQLGEISTFAAETSPFALEAVAASGARIRWRGNVTAISPLAGEGRLEIENASLPQLTPLARALGDIRLTAGRADLVLPYRFALGESPSFELEGARAVLREPAVAAAGAKEPFARAQRVALEGLRVSYPARRLSAKSLQIQRPALAARRGADGRLDLAALFGAAPREAKPAAIWQAEFGSVELAGATLDYADLTAAAPLALSLQEAGIKASLRIGKDGLKAQGSATVGELRAGQIGAAPSLRLKEIALSRCEYDSGAGLLSVESSHAGAIELQALWGEDGQLSLARLLPKPGAGGAPLAVQVISADLASGTAVLSDARSGAAVALSSLRATASGLSTAPGARPAFDVAAALAAGGQIAVRGRASDASGGIVARIEATDLPLSPLQPFVEKYYALMRVAQGRASASGTLRLGGEARLAFAGKAALADVRIVDPANDPLLGWKALSSDSVAFTLAPLALRIEAADWDSPAGTVHVAADHTTNLGRAFVRREPAAPGADSPIDVAVRRLNVARGSLDFLDDSIRPGVAVQIQGLRGTVNGISTDRESRDQFSLEGRVDRYGYAQISGSLNPFAPRERTNVRLELRNLELKSASPYAMKFAGFRLESGRLSLDLRYRVRGNLLEGDNRVVLEDFELGERVESPDKLDLPLEMAVQLLRDPDGRIRVSIPVSGDLDNPKFDLHEIVGKAVSNFITGFFAAPFRALAAIFGGEEAQAQDDSGAIAFDPGSWRLLPPEREKLQKVIAALAKHADLRLVVPAPYEPAQDLPALKNLLLRREVARRAGFAVGDDEDPGPYTIEDWRTRQALRQLFSERFSAAELNRLKAEAEAREPSRASGLLDKLASAVAGEPQVADAREFYRGLIQRLRESQPAPDHALEDLAQRRAAAIVRALARAGIDATRLAQAAPAPVSEEDPKRVVVRISLGVR